MHILDKIDRLKEELIDDMFKKLNSGGLQVVKKEGDCNVEQYVVLEQCSVVKNEYDALFTVDIVPCRHYICGVEKEYKIHIGGAFMDIIETSYRRDSVKEEVVNKIRETVG